MKAAFIALMIIHLLLHSLGLVKAFGIVEIPESRNHISKFQGIIWLLTSLLYLPALILYILDNPNWSIFAIITCIISQVLVIINWSDAKFATIPNLIILAVAIVHFVEWQFEANYKSEVTLRFKDHPEEIITIQDLESLPKPVRNYLEYAGVLGQVKVNNVKIIFEGEMRKRAKIGLDLLQNNTISPTLPHVSFS